MQDAQAKPRTATNGRFPAGAAARIPSGRASGGAFNGPMPWAPGVLNRQLGDARSWFKVVNEAGADDTPAQIYLYGEIGYYGVTAAMMIDQLRTITADQIELRINSPGGDVFEGLAIFNALRFNSAKITGYVDGLAASAASFIAMAADKLVMAETSEMMCHDAWGMCMGPADDMRQMADQLDRHSDMIAGIYHSKAGGGPVTWRNRMKAESWYNASEAVSVGLADEIAKPPKRQADNLLTQWDRARALADLKDLGVYRFAGRDDAPGPAEPAPAITVGTSNGVVTSTLPNVTVTGAGATIIFGSGANEAKPDPETDATADPDASTDDAAEVEDPATAPDEAEATTDEPAVEETTEPEPLTLGTAAFTGGWGDDVNHLIGNGWQDAISHLTTDGAT